MAEISINHDTCIKCGKCIRVCPSELFYNNTETKQVNVENLDACIRCGHCVAVCPTDAVTHLTFPASTAHAFDRKNFPTAEALELLIKSRRSNRAFSSQSVPEEYLQKILEAAYRAPTASNEQELSYTIVTNPEKLHQIAALTLDVFIGILKLIRPIRGLLKLFMPEVIALIPEFEEMVANFSKGKDGVLRGAKAVIFIHAPQSARFGRPDANLAYQNASLMAESLGVAHFYTGFVCVSLDKDKRKRRIAKLLGIDGEIYAGMALGMPAFHFEKYIDRKPMRVNWI
jgi:Nitroreductase